MTRYSKLVLVRGVRLVVTRGVIEPFTGPWSLPVVLVRKKDGSPYLRRLSQTERCDADRRTP
ncbi:hypothetical protein T10_5473 [Trichinella papuae]|uniref:Uncharacterized protein n=1 Tax=Trichinella papuae TaxID=268474 RepID=A0A0V1N8H8_9BILA|nr:hypothetical protein T10_5473 [Trichinella papuae]